MNHAKKMIVSPTLTLQVANNLKESEHTSHLSKMSPLDS